MSTRSLTTDQVLTLLADTPTRLATLTAGRAPVELRAAHSPDAWSANDVLAHLRSCADVWGDCIRALITQDRPSLRAISPRTWIKRTNYREWEFEPALRAFAAQRAELVAVLDRLPPEGWTRAASVTSAGKVTERTVLSYARQLADHERPHVTQVAGIMQSMHA